jgi:hypothetical protein
LDLYSELREAEEKLEKFVTENAWFMKMYREKYPITFEFTNGQINMFSDTDSERIPEIKFIFKSEVQYVLNTPEDMRIDEKFFSKLLSLSKEVHRLYLLHWFSQKDVRFEHGWTSMYSISTGDYVGLLSKSYRP